MAKSYNPDHPIIIALLPPPLSHTAKYRESKEINWSKFELHYVSSFDQGFLFT
jgi:hypothetical protein